MPDTSAPSPLARLVVEASLVPDEVARLQLGCSSGDLLEMALAGRLDGVIADGRLHVPPAQLAALASEMAGVQARTLATLMPTLRAALAGYLVERSATGDYDVALERGRPLVCARRGVVHVEHGVHMHAVACSVPAIAQWVADAVTRGVTVPDAEGAEDGPDLSRLPAADRLFTLLCALDGVTVQHNVTPLDGRPGSRRGAVRVRRWIRLDSTQWRVRLDSDVAARIGQVVDADGYPLNLPAPHGGRP